MEQLDQPHLSQIAEPLLAWYRTHARSLPWRSNPEPYFVWLSEIMLQQTRIDAAIGYYHRFLAALPTIADLAAADEETLLKLWEGLGYYNRVRNLQKAARIIMTSYGGQLPADFDALLALPGIGRYTAGAIGSIAFGLCTPAVDGNVLRVITRVLACDANTSTERVKRAVSDALCAVMPQDNTSAFNQALMELGALICLPNGVPLCGVCPLCAICNAHKLHRELSFPVKDSKPLRRIEVRTVLVPVSHGRIGICKRPESGLLRGLWELPSMATALAQEEAAAAANSLLLVPTSLRAIGKAKHVFSHIEWHMTGYAVFCDPLPDCALHWVTPSDIAATYCLPSAFRAYSAQLEALAKEK